MNQTAAPPKLIIRAWPKMIFLWPTAVFSLFMGLANYFLPDWSNFWGGVFIVIMGMNLMVLTFEFPRGTSLTVVAAVVAALLGLVLLNQKVQFIPALAGWIGSRRVSASTEFYICLFIVTLIQFTGMYVVTRFDYWELTPNEIVHHHGILGDVERFSTAGMKLNKEISDVFEYLLAGAGTVILLIPSQQRPIVLENVLNISKIERSADKILDARVVRLERSAEAEGADRASAAAEIARASEDGG